MVINTRDLKLENLILENDDIQSNLKVIDFGTCKIFKPKEIMKEITGSVLFVTDNYRRITLLQKSFLRITTRSVTFGVVVL